MTVLEDIKSKNIDEFVEWLDANVSFDVAPYMRWFDNNYCRRCEEEVNEAGHECGWCELNEKCKFFQELNDIPNTKQIIKMWLETEI